MTLPDKTLAFARSIGEQWNDPPAMDLVSFQQRYIYIQSLGAAHTARAYWILHRSKQHNECHILARNLLERIFNSRVAKKSPKFAVELIASEIADRIHHLCKWQNDQPSLPPDLTDLIARSKKDLQHFMVLLGASKEPRWLFYQKAKEAGLSWAYRSLYCDFSRYTHAGYEVSRPPDLNMYSGLPDFIALLAPIDTAIHLHELSCHDNPCRLAAEYKVLYDEIRTATHVESISTLRQENA